MTEEISIIVGSPASDLIPITDLDRIPEKKGGIYVIWVRIDGVWIPVYLGRSTKCLRDRLGKPHKKIKELLEGKGFKKSDIGVTYWTHPEPKKVETDAFKMFDFFMNNQLNKEERDFTAKTLRKWLKKMVNDLALIHFDVL